MTSRALAAAISALGLACLAAFTTAPARAADLGPVGRTLQAAAAGVSSLAGLFAPKDAAASWSAKASSGRYGKPKGGKPQH